MKETITNSLVTNTKVYCELVSIDHHKDKDMHFEVIRKFSYGREPYYYIWHNGYISDMESEVHDLEFQTQQEAEQALVEWLHIQIVDLLESYSKMDDTYDYNWKDANRLAKKYRHLTPVEN